jgi:hypothetical protein
MPLRSDWTGERCPIARSLEVLGDGAQPFAQHVLRHAQLIAELLESPYPRKRLPQHQHDPWWPPDCCNACRIRTGDVPGTSTS